MRVSSCISPSIHLCLSFYFTVCLSACVCNCLSIYLSPVDLGSFQWLLVCPGDLWMVTIILLRLSAMPGGFCIVAGNSANLLDSCWQIPEALRWLINPGGTWMLVIRRRQWICGRLGCIDGQNTVCLCFGVSCNAYGILSCQHCPQVYKPVYIQTRKCIHTIHTPLSHLLHTRSG